MTQHALHPADDDNDGISSRLEGFTRDTDGDGIVDHLDATFDGLGPDAGDGGDAGLQQNDTTLAPDAGPDVSAPNPTRMRGESLSAGSYLAAVVCAASMWADAFQKGRRAWVSLRRLHC